MKHITLRVLDGANRGEVYESLKVPVTIGREEGNSIQLNDERISRFHLKIQLDHDDLVLTDLQSTNGSRVNNEEVQLRILREGDIIAVGRSVLLFSADRTSSVDESTGKKHNGSGASASRSVGEGDSSSSINDSASAASVVSPESNGVSSGVSNGAGKHFSQAGQGPASGGEFTAGDPPKLPQRMSPGQAAQLSEVIEYLHLHLRHIIQESEISKTNSSVQVPSHRWQQIVNLQFRLAEYIHSIGNSPD